MSGSNQEEKKSNVTLQEGKGWKRTLEIEIPKEKVDDEFESTYKKYQTLAKIPGFRKGKAPLHMVKLRYQDKIKSEVLETLVPKAYEDAVKEAKLSPICLPVVKDVQFEEGAPLKFKAEFEIQPEVEAKDYLGLELVRRLKEISEKDIETSLNYLREDFAELHPVEREAHLHDSLIVDISKTQDGKEDKVANQQIFLDPHNMIKDFQQALVGAKAGELKEFEVDYKPDFHNKKLAGKKVKYRINVKEVKEKILPQVNDDFAKTVGEYKNLGELKGKIKEGLIQRDMKDADTELKTDLINQVIRRNPFEVPDTLFDYYLDSVIEDLKKRYQKVDEKKVREEYQDVALAQIRWDFLFHRIAEKENIQVTKPEMENWCEQNAKAMRVTVEEAIKSLENPSFSKRIKEDLLEKKTIDFLLKNAKIKEEPYVPPEPKKENSEAKDPSSKTT
ncbi:MAG: trigger factor [Candidatus Zixiibacteriota bacterium]